MAVSTDAWWRRGAWPALGRTRPSATPVLAVACLLLAIELVELLGQVTAVVTYARSNDVLVSVAGRPTSGYVLVRTAASVGPVDALIVLASALVIGCVRPGGLDRRQRRARRTARTVTAVLGLLMVALAVAPFYELGASSAHFGLSPTDALFTDTGRLICDRLAVALIGLTSLAALIGEWQARRITEGRVLRGEG